MSFWQRATSFLTATKKASVNQAWSDRPELWTQLGMPVTTGRAATSSPVEAGVSLIANDISTLPISVYQEIGDGTRQRVRNSPNARVLAKPNDYQTIVDFLNAAVRDTMFYGNFYAWADRDNRGQITAMYPLRPGQTKPHIAEDGSVYYSVALTELERGLNYAERPVLVAASDIFHHRIFTVKHPLIGVSPLYAIGNTAALNASIAENLSRFHQNAARPGGILIAPGGMKPETRDRLRQDFAKTFTGENAGRLAVLDFDAKLETLPYMSAQEAQAQELLNFTVEDVCRALRIPKHMMGLRDGDSAVGVESAMRSYYTHCLRPIIEGLEARFDDFFGLIGTDRFVEFELDQIFRAESDKRVDALTTAVQGGLMTPNEARRAERLAPVDGGDGAFLQRQMTPVSMLSELAAAELSSARAAEPAPDTEAESPAAEDQGRAIYEALIKEICPQPNAEINLVSAIQKEMRIA